MATYKVLQDIEAEDKLVGPLTFRQFVYAGICALNLYLCFLVISKGAPFAAIIFLPFAVIGGLFAWPWSRDQPTEVWALAKIRFFLKPRRRIWDQSGVKELVTITAPKRVERNLTNGLTQTEVRSRLRALSDTIDSRGWAIKNVNVNMYSQPGFGTNNDSDRLISTSSLPQPVETIDIRPADDMLDIKNNPVAAQQSAMLDASEKAHRKQLIDRMQQSTPPVAPPAQPQRVQPAASTAQSTQTNDYWFLNQPGTPAVVPKDTVTFNTQVVAPGSSVSDLPVAAAVPTEDEESFIKQLKAEPAFSPNMHGHLHVIQPLSAQKTANPPVVADDDNNANAVAASPMQKASPQVTRSPDPDTLDLVRNDDLDVATIAREAQRRKEPPADEVVISLH